MSHMQIQKSGRADNIRLALTTLAIFGLLYLGWWIEWGWVWQ